LYAFIITPMRAAFSANLIVLDLITLIFGEAYKLWSFSLCSPLQPPITFHHLGPNFLLSTLFSNTLKLCFSLSVKDHLLSFKIRNSGKQYYIAIVDNAANSDYGWFLPTLV
jgi:hypothetical protein